MAIYYFGSFQPGVAIVSENPQQEVWSYVQRLGTPEFLGTLLTANDIECEKRREYAAVRIRQAVEFRHAARESSLLTRPLPLYYSALNLLRAGIAIVSNIFPTAAHGLQYKAAPSLLDNTAATSKGTFLDFLSAFGCMPPNKAVLPLRDCLSLIPELAEEFEFSGRGTSCAIPVAVHYDSHEGLTLEFDGRFIDTTDFRSHWPTYFPKLAEVCALARNGSTLLVENADISSYEAIGGFCRAHLENRLIFNQQPLWYAIRQKPSEPLFPRAAYYVAALFILSSVVRYEPERLLPIALSGSELGWFLSRFLQASDRFLPQLLYSWITGDDIYFSYSV